MRHRLPPWLIAAGVVMLAASVTAPWFADGLTVPFQLWTLSGGIVAFASGCVMFMRWRD